MADIRLPPVPPVSFASGSSRAPAFKIVVSLLAFAILGAAWIMLLASVAPARLDFSSAGALLMVCAPPVLLALLGWTGVHFFSAPKPPLSIPADAAASAPVATTAPAMPVARFRIGAWSALTPQGNVIETVEGTKARNTVFKPDKHILHPSGYPAHAAIIDTLALEALGHAAGTRLRTARVMTLLAAILDDLHAQQGALIHSIEGPIKVYWLLPDALMAADDAHGAIFAGAWKHSAWRDSAHVLHAVPGGEASLFTVLSGLQQGIDQSAIACTVIVGADSLLDPQQLEAALALGQVFSNSAPQGFIPSEGAGGVVLFNPVRTPEHLWAGAAVLGPISAMQGDATDALLRSVMSAALTASGKDAVDIANVVSDTDHRSQPNMVVVGAMMQVLARLDPLEQRISPMEYAGAFGAASDLVHLALAAELASEKPALAVSFSGGQYASVVVMPA